MSHKNLFLLASNDFVLCNAWRSHGRSQNQFLTVAIPLEIESFRYLAVLETAPTAVLLDLSEREINIAVDVAISLKRLKIPVLTSALKNQDMQDEINRQWVKHFNMRPMPVDHPVNIPAVIETMETIVRPLTNDAKAVMDALFNTDKKKRG
jgi:hypothetical protein